MVSKTVELIFDFASPNAYLVTAVLPAELEKLGAELIITPCLLGGLFKATGNKAPMVQFADIPAKMSYEMLEMRRFIAKHELTQFKMNPHFPINTLTIMRGAIVAQEKGLFDRYLPLVNTAMWELGLNMGDPEVITSYLSENGLDGAAILARTQEDAIKAKLVANTEGAVARGAFGIPTFFVGSEMFFGKERIGQMLEELNKG
jgi:2-hydroxychromene-2-carboxylate isomerase